MTSPPNIEVTLGGQRIRRLQSLNLRLGMEELADSFSLVAADPGLRVAAGLSVEIKVEGVPVLVGRVMTRRFSARGGDVARSCSGLSSAELLVKSSVIQPRRTWTEISLRNLAALLVRDYGLAVEVDPSAADVADEPFDAIRFDLGDTVADFLRAAAKRAGCLITSGAAVTRPGEPTRAAIKILRVGAGSARYTINALAPRVLERDYEDDVSDLHSEYRVNRKGGGLLDDDGTLKGVDGVAFDERIPYSPIIISAAKGARSEREMVRQAEYEMRHRSALASQRTVVLDGWSADPNARTLWAPNQLVRLVDAQEGLDDDLLVAGVEFALDISGDASATRVEMLSPDAYAVFEKPRIRKPPTPTAGDIAADAARGAALGFGSAIVRERSYSSARALAVGAAAGAPGGGRPTPGATTDKVKGVLGTEDDGA